MTRSSRIRKPSQKAREIAEAALLLSSSKTTPSSSGDQSKNSSNKSARRSSNQTTAATGRNQSSSSSVRAKVKIGRKKGRATINSNGDVDVEEEAAKLGNQRRRTNSKQQPQQPQEEEDDDDDDDHATQPSNSNDTETEEDPDVLYCICLGHDDHTPMIQCEGCENWFHFSCINLDPTEAQKIEAFYCQLCNASGNGITRKIDEENPTTQPEQTPSVALISNSSNRTSENLPETIPKSEDGTPGDSTAETVPRLPSPQPVDLKHEAAPPVPTSREAVKHETAPSVPTSHEVEKKVLCDSSKDNQPDGPSRSSVESITVQPPQSTKATRRKQRLAEGLSSEGETSDEDFTGEESLRTVDRKRKTPTSVDSRPSTQPRISTSTPSSTTPSTPSTPVLGVEKTRKACIEQFFKLFEPIFSKNLKQDEDAAMRFSEAVELELYESFGELDAKNQKVPRRQYMTKLRSLLFNLKNNPAFLNSLSSLELSPKLIVFMSNEDLQTPEQKALAEQVRQRSLHDSVKTLDPVLEPTTSPQADEPIIGSLPPSKATENHVAVDQPQSATTTEQTPIELNQSRENPSSPSVPPPAQVPVSQSLEQIPLPDPPSVTQPETSAGPDKPVESSQSSPSAAPSHPENATTKCITPSLLSSFDLEKVFAAIRSVPPPQITVSGSDNTATKSQSAGGEVQKEAKEGDSDDSMDLENTPEREVATGDGSGTVKAEVKEKNLPDDYDPFVVANGVDADLEAILHGDQQPGTQNRPNGEPSSIIKESETQSTGNAQAMPSVWTGNVMTVDVGGFAACAVQVGGRPIGTDGLTWSKLIPTDTMAVAGRLPVKDSTNYLVQSHFAPSRELILLELKPNLNGPPELPSPERVLQHQQNLIEFFTKKGRHAVVAVNEKAKQAVRDIYLVPILRQDPLPEFVQLLDDVSIPESTPRARDMMVAVMVLSKGGAPSAWKSAPTLMNPSTSSSSVSVPTPNHQAQVQVAPPLTSSAQNLVGAAQSLSSSASNHGRSPAPVNSSSYSLPARQPPNPSAPIDPIPLLQSLSSKISSVSSQLAFPLLSQIAPSVSTTTPGPPPGFVPYVQPQQSKLPSVPSSSSTPALNGLDLSKVDVSALQALLSHQQAFKPILSHPQPTAIQPTNLHLAPASASTINQPVHHPSVAPEPRTNTGRHPGLPAPPRPANLPLNPHFAHQAAPSVSDSSSSPPPSVRHPSYPQSQQQQQQQSSGWPTSDHQHHPSSSSSPTAALKRPAPFIHPSREKQHRKGLMRMGDVIRSSPPAPHEDPRRRTSSSASASSLNHHHPHHHPVPPSSPNSVFLNHHHGPPQNHGHPQNHASGRGSKRHSNEFVAPPRDGGWAGRGRGRKLA
ncbi:hypothetical protein PGTUg99_001197 [Puccinia graminis f. sp. tritici]|uniref:Transcription factor BYE1 n=1 Tax=Puccinia graminis f. sp. tritici TaxID=56615 RepID=A0A5B0PDF5_PUCGR|nr:hypothetical protein PGTUg99_001197 [Puccinia graminis f. sp. tritici]